MDVRDTIIDAVRSALADMGVDPLPDVVQLERPTNPEHGDWSTNVALASAKAAGRNPRELGTALVERLTAIPPPHVVGVEVAGPGFVNFRLAETWLHEVLADVVAAGTDGWGRLDSGAGTRVIVEFVSANPTGPLHAGHGRGACYGDSVARLYERCGYEVEREFYVNDSGVQMQKFAASLAARAAGGEVPEDGYHGQYIVDWAAEMPAGVDPLEWGYERALADHRSVLESLSIHFDSWFSERSMIASGAIDVTMADLRDADAVYEADGAVWLRSSDHGDDKDRVLVKSDGEFTYLMPDVAYHRDKFSRADRLVNVWGADHHGYVARMHAAMRALGHESSELEVAITQMVSLQRGGEEVRLSKRTGEMVELAEVVDEVGADAVRFTYLLFSVDSQQTFDLDLVASQVNENPVFYVQYAHARVSSVMRKAAEAGIAHDDATLAATDLAALSDEAELAVARKLAEWPRLVEIAARTNEPHRVAFYLYELAGDFHTLWNRGNERHDLRFFQDGNAAATQAKLALPRAVAVVISAGLAILGVTPVDEMR